MVDHYCRDSAHLRYGLALVELACYTMNTADAADGEQLLVVPRIIQQVEPVQRAYVRVELAPDLPAETFIKSHADSKDEERTASRSNLTEDGFRAALRSAVGTHMAGKAMEFCEELAREFELELDFKAAAVMVKIPDPTGEKGGASVLGFEQQGRVYNADHVRRQLVRWGLPKKEVDAMVCDYWSNLHAIESGFRVDGISHMNRKQFLPLAAVLAKQDQIKSAVGEFVARIRAAIEDNT